MELHYLLVPLHSGNKYFFEDLYFYLQYMYIGPLCKMLHFFKLSPLRNYKSITCTKIFLEFSEDVGVGIIWEELQTSSKDLCSTYLKIKGICSLKALKFKCTDVRCSCNFICCFRHFTPHTKQILLFGIVAIFITEFLMA